MPHSYVLLVISMKVPFGRLISSHTLIFVLSEQLFPFVFRFDLVSLITKQVPLSALESSGFRQFSTMVRLPKRPCLLRNVGSNELNKSSISSMSSAL